MQDSLFESHVHKRNGQARPFLKWAGGKGQLAGAIEGSLPEAIRLNTGVRDHSYFEPFAGSAALFFHLRPKLLPHKSRLSDVNQELVITYLAVRDHIDALVARLREHEIEHNVIRGGSREKRLQYYMAVRAMDRDAAWTQWPQDSSGFVEHGARFVYLNKTCFNGLWRVNSRGHFNVPMGSYARPKICDEDSLRLASEALQAVSIKCTPFGDAVRSASEGDVVYFDPPYLPLSATSSFTSYAKGKFGMEDHVELALTYLDLAAQGVHVVLSNSDTAESRRPLGPTNSQLVFESHVAGMVERLNLRSNVNELFDAYRWHWNVNTVNATRAINAKADRRGAVKEIIVSTSPSRQLHYRSPRE